MKHRVDKFGDPVDPEMRRLVFLLDELAAYFRGALGNPERRAEIVRKYHEACEQLYSLGWDRSLDMMSELPDKDMPEIYLRLYPSTPNRSLKGFAVPSEFYKDGKKKTEDKEE